MKSLLALLVSGLGFYSFNAQAQQQTQSSDPITKSQIEIMDLLDKTRARIGMTAKDCLEDHLKYLIKRGRLSEDDLRIVKNVINQYGYDQVWSILHSDTRVIMFLTSNDPYHWRQQAEKNRESVHWEPANTALELAIRYQDAAESDNGDD